MLFTLPVSCAFHDRANLKFWSKSCTVPSGLPTKMFLEPAVTHEVLAFCAYQSSDHMGSVREHTSSATELSPSSSRTWETSKKRKDFHYSCQYVSMSVAVSKPYRRQRHAIEPYPVFPLCITKRCLADSNVWSRRLMAFSVRSRNKSSIRASRLPEFRKAFTKSPPTTTSRFPGYEKYGGRG